jgi:GH18 family chitinase
VPILSFSIVASSAVVLRDMLLTRTYHPSDINQSNYLASANTAELSKYIDFWIPMGYDMNGMASPMTQGYEPWPPGSIPGAVGPYDSGMADANSPLPGLAISLKEYIGNGIPAGQIVLGLPWYGYDDLGLWGKNGTDVPPGSPCMPHGGPRGGGSQKSQWLQMDMFSSNDTKVTTPLIYNHTTVSVHYDCKS